MPAGESLDAVGAQRSTGWAVVVPVKRLDRAKSRLVLTDDARAALVLAMLADTLEAVAHTPGVRERLVVTSDPAATELATTHGFRVVADPGRGLNAAVRRGLEEAVALPAVTAVAALTGDLPALRPEELEAALAAAAAYPSAFVPDHTGTGTSMLTSTAYDAQPRFGPGSRAAHRRAGAHELGSGPWPGLRCDVDTIEDLEEAARLGVGPHTAAVLASGRGDDLSRAS